MNYQYLMDRLKGKTSVQDGHQAQQVGSTRHEHSWAFWFHDEGKAQQTAIPYSHVTRRFSFAAGSRHRSLNHDWSLSSRQARARNAWLPRRCWAWSPRVLDGLDLGVWTWECMGLGLVT